MSNQSWNDWKFQIYWNKIERVNPRSHNEGKNPFCFFLRKYVRKIITKLHIVWSIEVKTPEYIIFLKEKHH